ncbi:META domain-containing protein [Nocardia sp. CDC159]|uniref:META domain-containing protein n=1 Tax=Nocardia pulmonis TaxID=2951408 RepID=A0A9X2EAE2_9NOCA|nr:MULTISPECIES: META domain-containing protein [Nocardia]MCM6776719.1 META domain-containing protein [Nocardia pulmonis]MCM6789132.1 META domain-containing protein [Nocardia sp. CDC159]
MSAISLRWMPLMAIAGLVIGCSSDHDHSDGPTPMGHTFVSTKVEGAAIPGGGPLVLTFADGRISAQAGCNTSSGPVEFDGAVLRVSGLATTMMGCPGERGGADGWQTGLLQSAPTWKLDGSTLTLTGNGSTVTMLDKKVAQPDRPLTGTAWTVTTLVRPNGQITSQVLEQAKPNLTIGADGQVSGSAGCNRMTGTAAIAAGGQEITFRIATTRMACEPEVMEVERQVLEALDGKTRATIDADTLTLRNDGNNTGLVLRAQD